MELSTTAIKGRKVNVIFTGSAYYFINSFFGVLAIAERDTNAEQDNKTAFTLYVGNHHTTGGSLCDSVIISAVKRFINKAESQFITKKVLYNIEEKDLANAFIEVKHIF